MSPRKALKDPKEIEAVPHDQPIAIELEPEGVVILDGAGEGDEGFEGNKKPEPKLERKEEAEKDDPLAAMKKQLEDLQAANTSAEARIKTAESERREAIQRAEEREKEAATAGGRADMAEHDAILNAMGAAKAEGDSAQRDLESAFTDQDPKAMGDAQRRISRAESSLRDLENAKDQLEWRAKNKPTIEASKPNKPLSVEAYIDTMPNLLDKERSWLKAHPDVMIDQRKNTRMQAAHFDAEEAGHARGSDSYFKFMEEKLGYRKPDLGRDDDDDDDDGDTGRNLNVSAPVSRNAPNASGKPSSSTRIELTTEQREIARNAGITDTEYARGLQRLMNEKKNGNYSGRN